jgi:hypothetical protein
MVPKVDLTAPPTLLDFIYARFAEKLSARDARSILRGLADYPTPTRNSQILALLTILRDEFQYAWSYTQVGYIFNVNKGIVHRVRSQAMREIEHDTGRPPILQPDQEAELIPYITSRFQDGSPSLRSKFTSMSQKPSERKSRLHGHGGWCHLTRGSSSVLPHILKKTPECKSRRTCTKFTSETSNDTSKMVRPNSF